MQKSSTLYNEKQMRYIQRRMKVSRRELVETISFTKISAESIAKYLKLGRSENGRDSCVINHLVYMLH